MADPTSQAKWQGRLALAGLLALGLVIGLANFSNSGPLWPDSPRYTNAACMMSDWFHAGCPLRVMAFAQDNYQQYPAFSVPYHPPGYPAVLAGWFLLVGASDLTARVLIALCWGLTGWLFLKLARDLGASFLAALLGAILLLTTPQLAIWSRDTMSEIPSFPPLVMAAIYWNRWLRGDGRGYGIATWVLVEFAFFVRVTTAGVLPGFVLFGLISRQLPLRRWPGVGLASALYLGLNASWVKFASQYAADEMSSDNKGRVTVEAFLNYFRDCGGGILESGSALAAGVTLLVFLRWPNRNRLFEFWCCWLLSYLAFKLLIPSSPEVRHFATGMLAFAGCSTWGFHIGSSSWPPIRVAVIFISVLALNLGGGFRLHTTGLVGYEPVAQVVAQSERPGNVLLACWSDQDWIFRYRTSAPVQKRYCLRSDRTLAIRVSEYANRPAEILAKTPSDVLQVIADGRVAFVLSCTSNPEWSDLRTEEMILVHETMTQRPDLFRKVQSSPVRVEFAEAGRPYGGEVHLWEVRAEVEPGPPRIPVVIPTAKMTWKPGE